MIRRFLLYPQLKTEKQIPYTKQHLRRLERAGLFPRGVNIGPRVKAWIEDEIDGHLAAKVAERDKDAA